MHAVLGVEGDIPDGEAGELGAAERTHPSHHQQTPVPQPARGRRPPGGGDGGDEVFEVGEEQRRFPLRWDRPHPADTGKGVPHLGALPGANNLERSWALLMVATQRARVAALYRHGTDRPDVAVASAASATYAATTPGSAGTPCWVHQATPPPAQ